MSQPIIPGDPYGAIKPDKRSPTNSPEPREVNRMHARSDVDSSPTAQHHTIGIKHNQAASGDHIHDGSSTRKLGAGLNLVLTGSKGGNVALANLITLLKNFVEFTDSTT